jgi:hypothetical protein
VDAVAARHRRKIRAWRSSSVPNASATDKEGAILLLASRKQRSYNTEVAAVLPGEALFEGTLVMDKFEEFGKRIDEEFGRLKSIKNFEDFGKRVDEELARVKSFVKEEVAPETEKRTAQFLREVSEKLTEAAGWIEARNAGRNAQNAQNPPGSQKSPSS